MLRFDNVVLNEYYYYYYYVMICLVYFACVLSIVVCSVFDLHFWLFLFACVMLVCR